MKLYALLFIAIIPFTSIAQSVESSVFELAIWSMLEKDVPAIGVESPLIEKAKIIDARSEEEYKLSHLKNAIWLEDLADTSNLVISLNKMDNIVVYCSIGYRSEKLCRDLISSGYTNTYNLYGGIFEWYNHGKTIYQMDEKTDSIHAFSYLWGIFLEKGTKVY